MKRARETFSPATVLRAQHERTRVNLVTNQSTSIKERQFDREEGKLHQMERQLRDTSLLLHLSCSSTEIDE